MLLLNQDLDRDLYICSMEGMRFMGQKRYDEVVIKNNKSKLDEVRKEEEKMAREIKEKEKFSK